MKKLVILIVLNVLFCFAVSEAQVKDKHQKVDRFTQGELNIPQVRIPTDGGELGEVCCLGVGGSYVESCQGNMCSAGCDIDDDDTLGISEFDACYDAGNRA